jgi:hypothetical protein
VEKVAAQAAHFLERNNSHKAYEYLQSWYKPTRTKATNPTDEEMTTFQQEYKTLYAAVTPTEPPISTYTTYNINNSPPEETKIIQALKKMRLNRSLGPSGTTINILRKGQYNATENQVPTIIKNMGKIVEIVQLTFQEGDIPISFSYGILQKVSEELHCLKRFIYLFQ